MGVVQKGVPSKPMKNQVELFYSSMDMDSIEVSPTLSWHAVLRMESLMKLPYYDTVLVGDLPGLKRTQIFQKS